jgi:hypothetical protein
MSYTSHGKLTARTRVHLSRMESQNCSPKYLCLNVVCRTVVAAMTCGVALKTAKQYDQSIIQVHRRDEAVRTRTALETLEKSSFSRFGRGTSAACALRSLQLANETLASCCSRPSAHETPWKVAVKIQTRTGLTLAFANSRYFLSKRPTSMYWCWPTTVLQASNTTRRSTSPLGVRKLQQHPHTTYVVPRSTGGTT